MAKKSKDTFTKDVGQFYSKILHGTLLAIDPASISMGWALYKQGELDSSGEFERKKGPPWKRIGDLMTLVQLLPEADVLAIEKIGKNRPLIWSVGAVIGVLRPKAMIETHYSKWHPYREESYTKSDRLDAELIGLAVIEEARKIEKGLEDE